ncbi:hypothetical protein [Naasia sp. SYSU D00948]|uniref:hypothetical protein n=1 Tax=Naasia sp. SYSU D00948 TaxID=2817379 RepID=UPI001B304D7F|nr:hypothetical protein [Naasia sp. SYSU D00948]
MTMVNPLAVISAAQLAVHLTGARRGIRDRIPAELPFLRRKPDDVVKDMWVFGSGMAAPWPMLAAHLAGILSLFGRARPWVPRAVGALGLFYLAGYLLERNVRDSFRRPDDRTVLHAVAILLAAAMAVLGLTRSD